MDEEATGRAAANRAAGRGCARSRIADIEPVTVADYVESVERLFRRPWDEIVDGAPPSVLRELNEQLELIRRREQEYRILYVKPYPYQQEFVDCGPEWKVQGVFGGNFSGKTLMGLYKAAALALGVHPKLSPGRGNGAVAVPNRGRVMASDFSKGLGEDVEPALLSLVPPGEIRHVRRNQLGYIVRMTLANGSVIDFLTYDQYLKDEKVGEGWKGSWAMFNEPPPEGLYKATLRGLMRSGMLWFCGTPLSEPWMYDQVYTNPTCKVWNWFTEQNPTLSPEQIADFKARLTPDEIEARLYGRFRFLSGMVYKGLRTETHVVKDFDVPPDWTRYMAIDWHPRKPVSMVWIAVEPKGRAYVYDELVIDGTVDKIAGAIKAKENGARIRTRFIDWLSAMPDRVTGKCPRVELARHGIYTRPAVKKGDVNVGIRIVQEYLAPGRDGGPGLVFFERGAAKTFHAMTHYLWDEYAGNPGQKEKPAGTYADLPDCVRYIMTVRPKHVDPAMERLAAEEMTATSVTGYAGLAPEQEEETCKKQRPMWCA